MSEYLPNPMIYCKVCQGILYTNLDIVKYNSHKFCSQECCDVYKKNNSYICGYCNKEIEGALESHRIHVNTTDKYKQNMCQQCFEEDSKRKNLKIF